MSAARTLPRRTANLSALLLDAHLPAPGAVAGAPEPGRAVDGG